MEIHRTISGDSGEGLRGVVVGLSILSMLRVNGVGPEHQVF